MFSLNFEPFQLIARLLVLAFCFPIHEFAHAFVAHRLGDPSPERDGRLTLSPLAHLDLWGSLLLLLTGFGWARPVMVNPYLLNRRSPYAMIWVALAGPVSNLLVAIVVALPFRLGLVQLYGDYDKVMQMGMDIWSYFILINLLLAVFNMIPLAPLDGDKVLAGLLPGRLGETFESIRPYGPMILMALLFVGPSLLGFDLIGELIYPPIVWIYRLLVF